MFPLPGITPRHMMISFSLLFREDPKHITTFGGAADFMSIHAYPCTWWHITMTLIFSSISSRSRITPSLMFGRISKSLFVPQIKTRYFEPSSSPESRVPIHFVTRRASDSPRGIRTRHASHLVPDCQWMANYVLPNPLNTAQQHAARGSGEDPGMFAFVVVGATWSTSYFISYRSNTFSQTRNVEFQRYHIIFRRIFPFQKFYHGLHFHVLYSRSEHVLSNLTFHHS